ncbi:hypothetical protein [Larkinella rosea]|uniref:Uncharacterized protein n=1 Tax=Larkinella rosea TaxID=2025312 RepID=A0A3P1C1Z7_9BACT|nr:hypothetical protein [Larkinella rosea]RRB07288.1 hypothetical protein EHT25_05795 [Larkinella rosea]
MKYDAFFLLSCIMGDEMYKLNSANTKSLNIRALEERFMQVWNQPIDDFYLSGLPPVIRRNARREFV